jgi:protoheme IX farnesyltransferase
MVLFSMAVAARTASEPPASWPQLAHALLGTSLVIMGAVALNQRMEYLGDAKMRRTAGRPLPSGRLTGRQVTRFGVLSSLAGSAYLAVSSGPILLALAAASWAVYVFAYTPLKRRSTWQTPIGAVAGAMPMLLGAAAGNTPCIPMALILFGILYFWQFPHSMAIAWLYRREFEEAEVRLSTVVDPSGRSAGLLAVLGSVALLPITLIPCGWPGAGWLYALAALLLGVAYMAGSVAFLLRRDDRTARRLLRVSLIYVPVLLVLLMLS